VKGIEQLTGIVRSAIQRAGGNVFLRCGSKIAATNREGEASYLISGPTILIMNRGMGAHDLGWNDPID
jgi:hypothetical protein